MLATQLQAAVDAGNAGRVTPGDLRIEINRRVLSDGNVSLHGAFRRRGKERKYVGYISTEEIKGYRERLAAYHPRSVGNASGDAGKGG